jgi:EAL domain-containing protein (putative c-di-GMP-specific phosphodiesterase class I)/CheY-like chemotaxis protein
MPEISTEDPATPAVPPQPAKRPGVPLCLVVDAENSVRQFISLILHGHGIETIELADGAALRTVRAPRSPDLIFHEISLESEDAIKSLMRLAKSNYGGALQLMSNRGAAVLDHVRKVGVEHKLNMLPILKKPFHGEAIVKIVADLKLGLSLTAVESASLEDALARNLIEFWYQPVINLRMKRLVGAEMYARIRHPDSGIILPAGFMQKASPESIFKLSEIAISTALTAGANYSKLGIKLPISINVPLDVLERLPVDKMVLERYPRANEWAGLVIDISEEQIIGNLALASELAKRLARVNVGIAVDNFGKGYSSLAKLKEFPFVQVKLDREFIVNCATDNVNAPLCKTMIDLAHNFGQTAIAMGIEHAGDALALVSMGCDHGQGFLLGQPMPEQHFASLLRQRTLKGKKTSAAPPL